MKDDLQILNKHDHENAELLLNLSDEEILPYVDHLLEWMRDLNWPVAQQIEPRLLELGDKIAPNVAQILQSNDRMWIYWVLHCFIVPSPSLQLALQEELQELKAMSIALAADNQNSYWLGFVKTIDELT